MSANLAELFAQFKSHSDLESQVAVLTTKITALEAAITAKSKPTTESKPKAKPKSKKKIEKCSSKSELKKFSKNELREFLIKKKIKSLGSKSKDELVRLAYKYIKEDSDSDSDSDDSDSESDSDSDDSDSDSD